mgnify:CR=1 FL=1|tara:strand:+ start:43 stop:486 length:444 start_codon:yes stop_codon:yes gene_type:complete
MSDKVTKNIRKALSKTDADKLAKAIRDIKPPMSNGIDEAMMKTLAAMMNRKEMGGEVIDMTKSQDVSMMDEGGSAISDADRKKVKKILKKKDDNKTGFPFITPGQKKMLDKQSGKGKPMEAAMGGPVKKMNMGGVVPGRGGSFKGIR